MGSIITPKKQIGVSGAPLFFCYRRVQPRAAEHALPKYFFFFFIVTLPAHTDCVKSRRPSSEAPGPCARIALNAHSWALDAHAGRCHAAVAFGNSGNDVGTWQEAAESCHKLGGILATGRSKREETALLSLLVPEDRDPIGSCWSGLRKRAGDPAQETWCWTDNAEALDGSERWAKPTERQGGQYWQSLRTVDQCGALSPAGWIARPCVARFGRLSCFLCTVDVGEPRKFTESERNTRPGGDTDPPLPQDARMLAPYKDLHDIPARDGADDTSLVDWFFALRPSSVTTSAWEPSPSAPRQGQEVVVDDNDHLLPATVDTGPPVDEVEKPPPPVYLPALTASPPFVDDSESASAEEEEAVSVVTVPGSVSAIRSHFGYPTPKPPPPHEEPPLGHYAIRDDHEPTKETPSAVAVATQMPRPADRPPQTIPAAANMMNTVSPPDNHPPSPVEETYRPALSQQAQRNPPFLAQRVGTTPTSPHQEEVISNQKQPQKQQPAYEREDDTMSRIGGGVTEEEEKSTPMITSWASMLIMGGMIAAVAMIALLMGAAGASIYMRRRVKSTGYHTSSPGGGEPVSVAPGKDNGGAIQMGAEEERDTDDRHVSLFGFPLQQQPSWTKMTPTFSNVTQSTAADGLSQSTLSTGGRDRVLPVAKTGTAVQLSGSSPAERRECDTTTRAACRTAVVVTDVCMAPTLPLSHGRPRQEKEAGRHQCDVTEASSSEATTTPPFRGRTTLPIVHRGFRPPHAIHHQWRATPPRRHRSLSSPQQQLKRETPKRYNMTLPLSSSTTTHRTRSASIPMGNDWSFGLVKVSLTLQSHNDTPKSLLQLGASKATPAGRPPPQRRLASSSEGTIVATAATSDDENQKPSWNHRKWVGQRRGYCVETS